MQINDKTKYGMGRHKYIEDNVKIHFFVRVQFILIYTCVI